MPVTTSSAAVKHGLTGPVPDPLVPVSIRPQPGSRQVFWISIAVPRRQLAGVYRGTIAIGRRSVSYRLRVVPVTLPKTSALHTWFLVWGRHADAAEHRAGSATSYTRLLARYGIGDGSAAGGDAAVGVRPTASLATSRPPRCATSRAASRSGRLG